MIIHVYSLIMHKGYLRAVANPRKKQPVRSNVPPGVISALAADHSGEQSSIR